MKFSNLQILAYIFLLVIIKYLKILKHINFVIKLNNILIFVFVKIIKFDKIIEQILKVWFYSCCCFSLVIIEGGWRTWVNFKPSKILSHCTTSRTQLIKYYSYRSQCI